MGDNQSVLTSGLISPQGGASYVTIGGQSPITVSYFLLADTQTWHKTNKGDSQ